MTTVVRPPTTRGKTVILWAATSVLAIFFILMGLPKVLGQTGWVARFGAWGYPDWFRSVVGLGEIAGAILLMIPSFARLGAAVLATIMVGAAGTHVWYREIPRIVLPIVFVGARHVGGPGARATRSITRRSASRGFYRASSHRSAPIESRSAKGPEQPVVKRWLHSTGDASSLISLPRQGFTTGC